jgi:uncharacterized cofD-like protein
MALAAMAGDDDWGQTWARLLQHRFSGEGPLAGHAVGNLLLTGLAEATGDPVIALDLVAKLLGLTGRVLPMSPVPLEICAEVIGLVASDPGQVTEVVGQVAVATTPGLVAAVHLKPSDPPACKEAVRAVEEADWVVFGPGSWFTSVLPHLLVPDLRDALHRTSARRLVALNLAPQAGETAGFIPESYLDALAAHAPDLQIDVVLADEAMVVDRRGLMAAAQSVGGRLVLSPLALGDGTPRHDPELLARAYEEVFGGVAWQ